MKSGGSPRSCATEIRGTVRDDAASRGLYAVDGSNYRAVPDLVVVPADAEDLATAVALTAAAGAPVTLRGGGTSMAGNAIGGVVIDASRHVNRILDIDTTARTAVVEPGVVLTDLLAAARPHGLDVRGGSVLGQPGHDRRDDREQRLRRPLRGVGNHSGKRAVAGRAARRRHPLHRGRRPAFATISLVRPGREGELHRRLQAFVDAHGLVIRRRFGRFTRQISGYALHRLLPEHGYDVAGLLCGSEGGFAATLQATVALTPLPAARVLCVLGFADSIASAECVPVVLAHSPLTMESINVDLVDRLPGEVRRAATAAGLPAGRAWLLVEMGGEDGAGAAMAAEKMLEALRDSGSPRVGVTGHRPWRSGGAVAVPHGCRRAGHPPRRRRRGVGRLGGRGGAAGTPGRLSARPGRADGSARTVRRVLRPLRRGLHAHADRLRSAQPQRRWRSYRTFVEEATDLVVSLGGSVSGEHGDGRARSELLGRMYGADGLRLLAEMKDIWDPGRVMNPGVIVDPPALDAGIRHMGAAKDRKAADAVRLSRRQPRLRAGAATLCRHRQVQAVLRRRDVPELPGDARGDAFHARAGSPAVGDAGGRSGDRRVALDRSARRAGLVPVVQGLPVGLPGQRRHGDVQGRVHPPPLRGPAVGAAAVALVDGLAAAVVAVRVEGAAAGQPDGPDGRGETAGRDRAGARDSRLRRADLHVVVRRPGRHRACAPTRGRVVLWPDTFTNHLAPEVGRAAVEVLEAAGYEVVLPAGPVCCGLTWISTGQLRVAEATHQALSGEAGAAACRGHAGRGFGAELHCGAAPRRGRTSAGRSARRRAGGVDLHIRGVPHPLGLATATGRRRTRWCRRTATSTPSSASTPTAR